MLCQGTALDKSSSRCSQRFGPRPKWWSLWGPQPAELGDLWSLALFNIVGLSTVGLVFFCESRIEVKKCWRQQDYRILQDQKLYIWQRPTALVLSRWPHFLALSLAKAVLPANSLGLWHSCRSQATAWLILIIVCWSLYSILWPYLSTTLIAVQCRARIIIAIFHQDIKLILGGKIHLRDQDSTRTKLIWGLIHLEFLKGFHMSLDALNRNLSAPTSSKLCFIRVSTWIGTAALALTAITQASISV